MTRLNARCGWMRLPLALLVLVGFADLTALVADDVPTVAIEVLDAAPEGASTPRVGDRVRFSYKASLKDLSLIHI